MTTDFGGGEDILFERIGTAGVVTLNRPQVLNALTRRMIDALSAALLAWQNDPNVRLVVIRANGKAFCAGGDLRELWESLEAGRKPLGFFAAEYRLNAQIARFPKPYLALIDGPVMGGGVGIACHGSHRVMTERAQFAMPEVGIGFFPDVGASHLLPDLGEYLGLYLGLTGNSIAPGDALWSGVATHTIKSEYLAGLFDHLCETDDAGSALRDVFSMARRETDIPTLQRIARHFGQPTLALVLDSLRSDNDPFAEKTLATLLERSPTSLAVAFRAIARGSTLSMDECMRMEFRITSRMLDRHDLREGIRARLIDKDGKPRWQPDTLAGIDDAAVEAFFAPLPDGDLVL